MTRRILVFLFFVFGGFLTWFVLAIVSGFGKMQAGMSAGAVPGPSTADTLIPWIACSYFALSAFSILIMRKRTSIRKIAILSHLLLLSAYGLICCEGLNKDSGNFFSHAFMLAMIMGAFFSPWIFAWGFILLDGKMTEQIR